MSGDAQRAQASAAVKDNQLPAAGVLIPRFPDVPITAITRSSSSSVPLRFKGFDFPRQRYNSHASQSPI
jgi:hypothetical protein